MEENEIEKLQKEENKLFEELKKLVCEKDKKKFLKILSDYVEIQLELERWCSE